MANETTFDFTGTSVLVTGGTSGIGHRTASAFREAGAHVTVTGTRETADSYDTDLTSMTYRQLIATDDGSVDAVAAGYDQLDVLVNNAGATFPGGLDEYTPEGFEAALKVNLVGPYRLTHGLHGALAASEAPGGASVISLVSMAAFRAIPLVPGYGSAKAGLVAATRNLASRWAEAGIRVNAVAPGNIETPMTAPMKAVPQIVDEQLAHIPMGRFGAVDDVVPTILFLASRQAGYITGTTIEVDGGYLLV